MRFLQQYSCTLHGSAQRRSKFPNPGNDERCLPVSATKTQSGAGNTETQRKVARAFDGARVRLEAPFPNEGFTRRSKTFSAKLPCWTLVRVGIGSSVSRIVEWTDAERVIRATCVLSQTSNRRMNHLGDGCPDFQKVQHAYLKCTFSLAHLTASVGIRGILTGRAHFDVENPVCNEAVGKTPNAACLKCLQMLGYRSGF
jgi:hypothetical protein